MIRVEITGWREGLNKVELNHVLREHVGLGLASAKRAVDTLLEGGRLTYGFPGDNAAGSFLRSVLAAGADGRIEEASLPSASASPGRD